MTLARMIIVVSIVCVIVIAGLLMVVAVIRGLWRNLETCSVGKQLSHLGLEYFEAFFLLMHTDEETSHADAHQKDDEHQEAALYVGRYRLAIAGHFQIT
jgi:ABC-type lipoprotein release transport system permease subunit